MKRTDLPALSIFSAVAARRSFRGAARDLGLSVSAVSHAIYGLEASLGIRILARTTRSVAPTEAGRRLLDGLEPALAAIAEAVENATASQQRLSGTLRFSVPHSAAEMLLLPLAVTFMRAHPDVAIEIRAQDDLRDIVADGFDAGIRFEESLEQDMIAVPLGPAQCAAIVAAPSYFTQHPRPVTPRDLYDHACINRRFPGGTLYRWDLEKDGVAVAVAVSGSLILDDMRLIAQAARMGAGLAYVFEAQVTDDLATGRLVRVLEDWCPRFPGFFLYYPSRRLMRPVLRAFLDFVRAEGVGERSPGAVA
ncbi:LysR family transcriptional regulator [Methylobacterium sp. J-077]|uniref:LysR family transcriptional regulator n=1 Tax=Methylobacterium sp. J-077 TaxID=2836656 RepID=UPI001FB97318|nr:LysR family transcriptional regulator [Methylobacterium sp. J-077]MCJ2121899.1 LysR substrate-binding domain-containing protein [Methylobacterium sp. J-077]